MGILNLYYFIDIPATVGKSRSTTRATRCFCRTHHDLGCSRLPVAPRYGDDFVDIPLLEMQDGFNEMLMGGMHLVSRESAGCRHHSLKFLSVVGACPTRYAETVDVCPVVLRVMDSLA